MEKKRPRGEEDQNSKCPEWWSSAVQWVVSGSGGIVHPGVTFDKENRELLLTQNVEKDEILLQIPSSRLISVIEATKSSDLAKTISTSVKRVANEDLSTTKALFNNEQDVALALILAASQSKADNFYQPYLETLPGKTSYDMIPRRWEKSQLERLLTGSNLINRVEKSKEGTINDYNIIRKAWNDLGQNKNAEDFPSFDSFSDMLAAVTSRAFAGMGGSNDDDIAMVPLLDLANHHRGSGVKKNVSYSRHTDGSVQIRTTQKLNAGTNLRITYGAQGNGQLLLNYGFTIPNNIEPDGSSNDVLEFLATSEEIVELRAGPKSYTFGPLAKAIELFYPEQGTKSGDGSVMNKNDDMEAFLDQCDEEEEDGGPEAFLDQCEDEEDEEEDFDWNQPMGGTDGDDDEFGIGGPTSDDNTGLKNELKALDALREALMNAEKQYSLAGNELSKALSYTESSPLYFSAILVSSETRTIRLYLEAIRFITEKLSHHSSATETSPSNDKTVDEKLVSQQAAELANSFLTIRYPSFQ